MRASMIGKTHKSKGVCYSRFTMSNCSTLHHALNIYEALGLSHDEESIRGDSESHLRYLYAKAILHGQYGAIYGLVKIDNDGHLFVVNGQQPMTPIGRYMGSWFGRPVIYTEGSYKIYLEEVEEMRIAQTKGHP